MDPKSTTPAADKQRPQGISATRDGKLHTFNLDPSAYGYHAPNLSDQELVAALVEDHNRTLRNIMDVGPAGPENLTFEDLRLPVSDAPIERLPAILVRDDGESVLYAQRFSSLHGEPGCRQVLGGAGCGRPGHQEGRPRGSGWTRKIDRKPWPNGAAPGAAWRSSRIPTSSGSTMLPTW